MVFNTGAALLDAIVLAVVSKEEEGTYGYKITQDVRVAIEVSESTGGRNRRYYRITDEGRKKLDDYRREWDDYSSKISELFSEEGV